jgi:hypothetical protein
VGVKGAEKGGQQTYGHEAELIESFAIQPHGGPAHWCHRAPTTAAAGDDPGQRCEHAERSERQAEYGHRTRPSGI